MPAGIRSDLKVGTVPQTPSAIREHGHGSHLVSLRPFDEPPILAVDRLTPAWCLPWDQSWYGLALCSRTRAAGKESPGGAQRAATPAPRTHGVDSSCRARSGVAEAAGSSGGVA